MNLLFQQHGLSLTLLLLIIRKYFYIRKMPVFNYFVQFFFLFAFKSKALGMQANTILPNMPLGTLQMIFLCLIKKQHF